MGGSWLWQFTRLVILMGILINVDSVIAAGSNVRMSSSSSSSPSSSSSSQYGEGQLQSSARSKPSYYPAIFAFGDSLSDTGNNNNLFTLAKAVQPPYGRDFVSHAPTGRFCNGLIGTDYLAELVGLPFLPPYLSAGDNVMQGVSFASGGSGILNSSGNIFGQHVALSQQLTYFAEVKGTIERRAGEEGAARLFAKALFYINIGSNDYITNYLLTNGRFRSPLQLQYSPRQFVHLLLSNLQGRIMELYEMGARKVAIAGLTRLGCVPEQLLLRGSKNGECIDSIDELTRAYNVALLQRIQALQASYPDALFTYLDTYNLLGSIVKQPYVYGFENVNTACCGSGRYGGLPTCGFRNVSVVCEDASKYVFWDFVHPTAAMNKIAAHQFWTGSFPEVNPFNLKELALA